MSQGGPQGNPLMPPAFCLAIHPFVQKLHDRLTREGVGGAAMFDMDDGYAIGPPGEVFEAVEEFLEGIKGINLMARVDKFEVWAPQADVSGDAARRRLGIPLRSHDVPQGIPVAGVPVGEPEYERRGAERVAGKVAADVDAITAVFRSSPHHSLWEGTYSSRN